jgi:hypothetical protein
MKRRLALLAVVLVGFAATTTGLAENASRRTAKANELRDLSLEFIGQFQNSAPGVTPVTHIHYGYLSYIRGIPAFKASPQDETTALFTFFADAATPRVIVNGPLRVITRIGTLTIYNDPSTNSNFANPDSFRDGTPILVAAFRQQSILNTITNSATTFHQNTITSTQPFEAGKSRVQLGVVGERFTTRFVGQVNMPGPPSGYIAGYAVSG